MADLGDPAVAHTCELRERGRSARKLVETCEREGTAALTRSVAVNVVSGNRRLVADKASKVVQVLDATASYSLEAAGPRIFLSYADEDREIGCQIAERLTRSGLNVVNRLQRGGGCTAIEDAISSVDAFVALLSPNYSKSSQCHLERQLGTCREQRLQADDPGFSFVHVLQVHNATDSDAGLMAGYDWPSETILANLDADLIQLAITLKSSSHVKPLDYVPSRPRSTKHNYGSSSFIDRQAELDMLTQALSDDSGPHFWLVVAPPRLGKTWFLSQLSTEIEAKPSRWVPNKVDLREQPPDVRVDAGTLLAYLLRLEPPVKIEAETLRGIAHTISRNGRSYLCMLDSAELLGEETAETLRWCFSRLYALIETEGNVHGRIALVVASRWDDEKWRGVFPAPRFTTLSLTEFTIDAVQDALRPLASQIGHTPSSSELRQNAVLVHRLTEGLPALLGPSLKRISAAEWPGMERLEGQEIFEDLAEPYIRESLLVQDSLFERSEARATEEVRALEQAFRILARYRLFTQSHLRYHLESDPGFKSVIDYAKWSQEDLWNAISGASLLKRPLGEPWQEINAAIRRLLYRYYYTSDEQRAIAHREARNFVEIWTDRQAGREQVIGLVECLWHEAEMLRLTRQETAQALSESARKLSSALRPSAAFTLPELQAYAAQRIRHDKELQESIDDQDGLSDTLAAIVAAQL